MMLDPHHLLGLPPRVICHRYSVRDTILYALGVGAGQNDARQDLRYVYEDGLEALPTMAVVLGYPGFWQMEPEYGIDWTKVLHAEQSCSFHAPFAPAGEVRSEMLIDSIADKGADKGCLLRTTREIFAEPEGTHLATVRQLSFLRGDGGCGSHGKALSPLPPPPERDPDAVLDVHTSSNQALLYRLSGDYNPLHVDPEIAAAAGFAAPILHGLCTYGLTALAIVDRVCGDTPATLTEFACRFTAPVFPGDRLRIELWQSNGDVAFRVHVPARELLVLDRGQASFTRQGGRHATES